MDGGRMLAGFVLADERGDCGNGGGWVTAFIWVEMSLDDR